MANEPSRLSTIPAAQPAEGDYDAICAAVLRTARGPWFLGEHARRNRNADTDRVLRAIARIQAALQGERSQHAQEALRVELLDIAQTLAPTRAAEIKPEAGKGRPAETGSTATSDIFSAAEHLQDLAWTMRERGLDTTTCEQIEVLASTILSASSLRDPGDRRAQKLGEILPYLEQRVDAMLASTAEQAKAPEQAGASSAGGETAAADAASEPELADFLLEPLPTPSRGSIEGSSDTMASRASPHDNMADIEQELFAAPPTSVATPVTRPAPPAQRPAPQPKLGDPLAALNAMSDEERIALFT
jgi:hypothetical protein